MKSAVAVAVAVAAVPRAVVGGATAAAGAAGAAVGAAVTAGVGGVAATVVGAAAVVATVVVTAVVAGAADAATVTKLIGQSLFQRTTFMLPPSQDDGSFCLRYALLQEAERHVPQAAAGGILTSRASWVHLFGLFVRFF